MKTNSGIMNARDTQRKSRRVYLLPAGIALALLLAGVVLYFQAPAQAVLNHWWSLLPPTVQDLVTMAAIIGAVVTAATISVYVSKRIYLARRRSSLASVAIVAGGGYASFLRRMTQGMPRNIHDHIHQAYVLTSDGLRGNQGRPAKPKKYEFNTRLFIVPHGEGGTGSRAMHEALGPQYAQHLKPVIEAADRVYLVVSRGGGTGTGTVTALTRQAFGRPTALVITGKSPPALLQAVADPQYACKARAFASRQETVQLGWTTGKPGLVEVTA